MIDDLRPDYWLHRRSISALTFEHGGMPTWSNDARWTKEELDGHLNVDRRIAVSDAKVMPGPRCSDNLQPLHEDKALRSGMMQAGVTLIEVLPTNPVSFYGEQTPCQLLIRVSRHDL